jgi:hypothetical protein
MSDAMALFVTSVLPCGLGVLAILVAEATEQHRMFEELMDYLLTAEIFAMDLRYVEQIIAQKLGEKA